jgi:hypothetical protein
LHGVPLFEIDLYSAAKLKSLSWVGRALRLQIKHHFINITPAPAVGWIVSFHDGLRGRMIVLGSMFVFGTVTTTDMPAFATDPKVDPSISHLQTFLAAIGGGRYIANGAKMSAFHFAFSSD